MRHTAGAYVLGPYLLAHQRWYRLSKGAVGRHVLGRPALLLHTTGRRSGKRRTAALVYAEDGGNHIVIASYGGAPQNPAWLLNLEADPDVEVQIGRKAWPAYARVAHGAERERLWQLVNEQNRGLAPVLHRGVVGRYDVYQLHTNREIPLVILEPRTAPA